MNVSARSLTITACGRIRGFIGLVRIAVHYTLLHIMVEMGGISLIIAIMGPPLQCSGLNWLFRMVCNLFFGDSLPSSVPGPGLCGTVRWGH